MEQIVRDARIGMIYEGANGVQAMDLVLRKLARDQGEVAGRFAAMVAQDAAAAPSWLADPLRAALSDLQHAGRTLLTSAKEDPNNLGAGAYAFMEMVGIVAIGWKWARIAAVVAERDDEFAQAKIVTARHYAEHTLPMTAYLLKRVEAGASNIMAMPAESFVRS